jgi:hypothetical protein
MPFHHSRLCRRSHLQFRVFFFDILYSLDPLEAGDDGGPDPEAPAPEDSLMPPLPQAAGDTASAKMTRRKNT